MGKNRQKTYGVSGRRPSGKAVGLFDMKDFQGHPGQNPHLLGYPGSFFGGESPMR